MNEVAAREVTRGEEKETGTHHQAGDKGGKRRKRDKKVEGSFGEGTKEA